jgi:hypothetical protein
MSKWPIIRSTTEIEVNFDSREPKLIVKIPEYRWRFAQADLSRLEILHSWLVALHNDNLLASTSFNRIIRRASSRDLTNAPMLQWSELQSSDLGEKMALSSAPSHRCVAQYRFYRNYIARLCGLSELVVVFKVSSSLHGVFQPRNMHFGIYAKNGANLQRMEVSEIRPGLVPSGARFDYDQIGSFNASLSAAIKELKRAPRGCA